MQKWEYMLVYQNRGYKARDEDKGYHAGGEWTVFIWSSIERGEELKGSFIDFLNHLGEQSWELVSVMPKSNRLGGLNNMEISGYLGNVSGSGKSADFAGFTDEVIWAFKRPKQ